MCSSCGSSNQSEFPAEMLIHFDGYKNISKPGVWVFPTLVVCMECGLMQSTVPAPELALLVSGTSTASSVDCGE
jgi:hypothetical protein